MERRRTARALARLALSVASIVVSELYALGVFVGGDERDVGAGSRAWRGRVAERHLHEWAIFPICAAWSSLKISDAANESAAARVGPATRVEQGAVLSVELRGTGTAVVDKLDDVLLSSDKSRSDGDDGDKSLRKLHCN